MMQVFVLPIDGAWYLVISKEYTVISKWTAKTLIDAINLAHTLQIHITNIDRLPVKQRGME